MPRKDWTEVRERQYEHIFTTESDRLDSLLRQYQFKRLAEIFNKNSEKQYTENDLRAIYRSNPFFIGELVQQTVKRIAAATVNKSRNLAGESQKIQAEFQRRVEEKLRNRR